MSIGLGIIGLRHLRPKRVLSAILGPAALFITFGALTAEGAGGRVVTGASITSGDPLGHWQIAGGRLSPSAAGAGSIAGIYNLTFDDGSTATVSVLAGARSAATEAEAQSAIDSASDGETILLGPGTWPSLDIDGASISANFGSTVTIRPADLANPPSITYGEIAGAVSNIAFENLPFQMTGWPATHGRCFFFSTGTFDGITFDGCSFRHGYGPTQANFDRTATYPEYARVDNVQTATTTTATYALSWQDATATDAWIECFNRGSDDAYIAVGGSGISASAADTLVPAGTRVRITGLDPTTDTHFAIISVSGTPEINARAEIGMSEYLAAAFASSGTADCGDLTIRNCTFTDLNNALKGLPLCTGAMVLMNNGTRRVYQDQIAAAPAPGGEMYILRNILEAPFARSGIAENLSGDARDPHGDYIQAFGQGAGAIGPIYSAGNRTRFPASRADVSVQGIFWSDNDNDPSYRSVLSIADLFMGGTGGNGITSGEPGFPVDGLGVYGATVVDVLDLADNFTFRTYAAADQPAIAIDSIFSGFVVDGGEQVLKGTIDLSDETDGTLFFADYANVQDADTRAEIETAMTAIGGAAGKGAVAAGATAIDWTTADYTQVIDWSAVPSFVAWADAINVPVSTLTTFPLRRVLNPAAGQTVVPGAGVEWRSVDADGTTEVQAWTTSSGTINGGQHIHIRATSNVAGETTDPLLITINGIAVTTSITTASTAETFSGSAANPNYFNLDNDAGRIPASTSGITARFTGLQQTNPSGFEYLINGTSTVLTLDVYDGDGSLRSTVEDSAGNKALSNVDLGVNLTASIPQDIVLAVSLPDDTLWITIDGTTTAVAMTDTANEVFPTGRWLNFFATFVGGNHLDYTCESVELWYSVSADPSDGSVPAGAADWSVTGPQATAKADPNAVTAPDVFDTGDWSASTGSGSAEIDITLTTLPASGANAITDVEYELDASGTWTSLPAYAGTGPYTITAGGAGTSYDVRIRAVNSVGNGAASDTKAVTSGA